MSDWLQFGIVLLAVGSAASYLLLRAFSILRTRRGRACGGCSGCPKSTTALSSSPGLVQLEAAGEPLRR